MEGIETPNDSWTILDVAIKLTPSGWENLFRESYYELETISNWVKNEEESKNYVSFPKRQDIFRAFELTPLEEVEVVILGQDPYHSTTKIYDMDFPTATGLAFSSRQEDVIPPSLKNVFKELADQSRDFIIPNHGDLTSWAIQGVLLLNTVLTVQPHKAESHKSGVWEPFIKRVFTEIAKVNPKCIYMLWGNKAQKLGPLIGNKSKILTAGHPSPLSSRHFFGCNHFNICNEELIKKGKNPINWNIPMLEDEEE